MKEIKNFEDFVKRGIIKEQNPDKLRAEFLIKEAEQDYQSLLEMKEKIELSDQNANSFIKHCYDILMETIRAKMLVDGYNASGFGAHEAEVSYFRVLGFSEKDVQFADQLRYFRNGMLYYGTILDKEYAVKVLDFLREIYPKLRRLLAD